jgi:hypothetical protein
MGHVGSREQVSQSCDVGVRGEGHDLADAFADAALVLTSVVAAASARATREVDLACKASTWRYCCSILRYQLVEKCWPYRAFASSKGRL